MCARYDDEEDEFEELKPTTDLRQKLEARREIKELNCHLQEEVNLKDKLIAQIELPEIDSKWEDMQAKMEAMEKRVATGGAYVNLEMFGSFPFTQEVDNIMPLKGFKLPKMESYDETTDLIDHLEMF